MVSAAALASLLLSLAAESVDDGSAHQLLFVPIPIASYNSDEGVGVGAVLGLQHRYGGVVPLKNDASVRLFITSKLVQRHELRWEGIDVFDLPLRVWTRIALFSTMTQTFCGYGNGVSCSEARAHRAALDAGLEPFTDEHEEFVRRYYMMRYVRPHADAVVRLRLWKKPHAIELFGGWRLAWYLPGTFTEEGPWPGSLYARAYPHGERGVSSVPQLGITVDDRDFEPAPKRGYFFETSLRGASPWWGSTWSWVGVNASLHGFQEIVPWPSTVYAGRVLVDVIVGEPSTEELAQIGGTKDHAAFGGQWIGRGVRDHRYLGKLKLIHQAELRTDVGGLDVAFVRLDFALCTFADIGFIGYDVDDLGGGIPGTRIDEGSPAALVYGLGVGLRVLVNRAFVGRLEGAASPLESRSPSFYTPVGSSI